MTRRQTANIGIVLLIIGGLSFVANSGVADSDLFGSVFLAAIGAGFALTYARRRKHWWAIIPAGVLFTLAVVAGVSEVLPSFDPAFLFFAGIAATFGYLYTLPEGAKRWAIYPALATFALAILSSSFTGTWLFPLLLIAGGMLILKQKDRGAQSAIKTSKEVATEPEQEDAMTFLERPSWEEVVEDLKESSAS